MELFRKLVSNAVLTLGVVGLASSLASAQSAQGAFTLTHEVHWQNNVVPAGEYRFSVEPKGPTAFLTLRRMDGAREGFMMLVSGVAPTQESGVSRILLVSRSGKSFVSTMELPAVETTLHFAVPAEDTDNKIALAGDHSAPTRLR